MICQVCHRLPLFLQVDQSEDQVVRHLYIRQLPTSGLDDGQSGSKSYEIVPAVRVGSGIACDLACLAAWLMSVLSNCMIAAVCAN